MKKETPNIVFLDNSLRGVLDTLFAPKIKQLLFEQVVESIQTSYKTKRKECTICNIGQLEITISLPKSEWELALKEALDHFIKSEDYSRCSQINALIQEIEQNGRRLKT